MSPVTVDADVVVIGGGLAGLRAASLLDAAGVRTLVLEARDRLGGRTHTRSVAGAALDLGGQYIGPGQPRMYRLIEDLGLTVFPTYVAGKKILETNGKATAYTGTIPFVSPLKLLPLYLLLTRIERAARKVPPDAPWDAPQAETLDQLTLEAARRRAWVIGSDVRHLMDVVVRTVFGAEMDELSLLHLLWTVSSNNGLRRLIETRGGYQQDRIVGGAQQFTERLATALRPERVLLNAVVRTIRQDADGVTIESSATTWRARRVVVAVAPAIAGQIRYEPSLPDARIQIHDRMNMGNTVKVLATYARPFWRERGLSGEGAATSGAISATFDNTTHDGSTPCLLGFVVGRAARRFATMSEGQRRSQILAELALLFGPEARSPLAYVEMDWSQEPFSGGSAGNFLPGALWHVARALRTPVGRVHWAGTETARQGLGYMEGAVESGDRVAAELLQIL